jgi:hypothetical protein
MTIDKDLTPPIIYPDPMSSKRTYVLMAFPQDPLKEVDNFENLMGTLDNNIVHWGAREINLTGPVADFFTSLAMRRDLAQPVEPALRNGFQRCFEFSNREIGTRFAKNTLDATDRLGGMALVISPVRRQKINQTLAALKS